MRRLWEGRRGGKATSSLFFALCCPMPASLASCMPATCCMLALLDTWEDYPFPFPPKHTCSPCAWWWFLCGCDMHVCSAADPSPLCLPHAAACLPHLCLLAATPPALSVPNSLPFSKQCLGVAVVMWYVWNGWIMGSGVAWSRSRATSVWRDVFELWGWWREMGGEGEMWICIVCLCVCVLCSFHTARTIGTFGREAALPCLPLPSISKQTSPPFYLMIMSDQYYDSDDRFVIFSLFLWMLTCLLPFFLPGGSCHLCPSCLSFPVSFPLPFPHSVALLALAC